MSSSAFDTLSDEELAALHLAGHTDAFEELVRRFHRSVYRLAYRFTSSVDHAQDITQETFVRVYQHLPRVHLDQPLKPWILQICVNLCRNLAKKRTSLTFSQLESQSDDEHQSAFIETIASTDVRPDERMHQHQRRADVQSALAHLPPHYRVALSLYYYDDLTYEEIAKTLSIPLNTVRTHIHRAKAELAKQLSHPSHGYT